MVADIRQLPFMEESAESNGLDSSQGLGKVGQGSGGGAATPLLELKDNTVDKSQTWERETVEHVLVSCSCRSRFCPDCAERQGYALRLRVKAATADWKAVQMWTLTVDPDLFDGDPRACFDYVRGRRAISEWIKALKRAGHLIDNRYFCVVEWQKNGFPHWHILVQARNIPHDYASKMWDRNRPKHLPPVDPNSNKPGFGFIGFTTTKKHQSVDHAVNYATKYCIKYPEEGFPDWVLDYEGRIDRFSASQNFWKTIRERDCKEPENELDENVCQIMTGDCDCPKCRGDEHKKNYRRTIRERVAACAQKCSVMLKRRKWDSEGNELKPDYVWAFSVDMDYLYAANDLKHFEGTRETVLTAKDYVFFRELMGIEDDSKQYETFDPSLLWRQDGAHYGGPNYEYIIS